MADASKRQTVVASNSDILTDVAALPDDIGRLIAFVSLPLPYVVRYGTECEVKFVLQHRDCESSIALLASVLNAPNVLKLINLDMLPSSCFTKVSMGFCKHGDVEIVSRLLEFDSRVTWTNLEALLICAAKHGHVKLVELLLDRVGVHHSTTALSLAAKHGHAAVVALLLSRRPPSLFSHLGALLCACRHGHIRVVQEFLKHGLAGYSITAALEEASSSGHSVIVALLLRHYGTEDVTVALHCAAHMGHERVVELLLKHGGASDAVLKHDALLSAARHGHCGVVSLLLQYGAAEFPKSVLSQAAHAAMVVGHNAIAKLLS